MEKNKLVVIDTTLRDGEQSAGVSFSHNEKLTIAKSLDKLGVDIIEAGIPIMGVHEQKVIAAMIEEGLHATILTWNRMKIEDIKASIATGATNHHISVPVSDIHIVKKLGMTRAELLYKYECLLDYCGTRDISISIGGEDASRADQKFLSKIYEMAYKYNARRIRYADTVSVLSPFSAYDKIEQLINHMSEGLELPKEYLKKELLIDFHGHNDFGLGTGNAIGAFKAGASAISCSVNGLGERAGNTALEEIVLALQLIENIHSTIDPKEIMSVSKLVEDYSGRKLQLSKPVVGKLVFSHEAGIHVDGLLKDPRTYTYLDPKYVGRNHSFVKGKHSGKSIQLVDEMRT